MISMKWNFKTQFPLAKTTVHKLLERKLQSLTSKICSNRDFIS